MKSNSPFYLSENLLKITILLFSSIFALMYFVSSNESNYAIITLVLMLSISSYILVYAMSNKKTIKEMLMINSFFTLIYMIHMLTIYYLMIDFHGQWNVFIDESHYFTISIINVEKLIHEGKGLLDIVDNIEYRETALYLYVQGYIGLMANYFDHDAILTQKLLNVYIASLIPTVLYFLLSKTMNKREALYASIIYGLFSFNLAYSAPLIRDAMGAFLYIMIFYYYLLPTSNKNFIFIFIFTILSYYLRPETGMYAFLIAFSYLYFRFDTVFKSKTILKLTAFIFLLPLIIFLIVKFNSVDTLTSLAGRYGENSLAHVSGDSLGSALLKLPLAIRLPLKFFQGQITYFPPWSMLIGDISFIRLSEAIASVSWFYVWPLIIVGIMKDKLLFILDKKLIFLLILSVGYIVLSGSVAVNPRQLMYVYPIIFLIATISFVNMNVTRRKKVIYWSFVFYILLVALYLFLKYLR